MTDRNGNRLDIGDRIQVNGVITAMDEDAYGLRLQVCLHPDTVRTRTHEPPPPTFVNLYAQHVTKVSP